MLTHAFEAAKRFIYIEDQYLVNPLISKLLLDALNRGVEHVTILIPHGSISDQPDGRFHRHAFLEPLLALNTPTHRRVRVYCRAAPCRPIRS